MEQDQQFVETLVKAIVNKPDAVVVTRTVDELGVLLSVKVDAEDMGLLIGRAGATAKAIRTLARIVGLHGNARVNIRILEPDGSFREHATEGRMASRPEKTKTVDDVVGAIQ